MSEPAVTAPAKTDENVPSTEVKPEVTPEVKKEEAPIVTEKNVDFSKINEQLTNLNKALSIEREEKKQLKEDLEKIKPFYENVQKSFTPEKPPVVSEEKDEQQKFEEWYAEKKAVEV
jgi:hypothetical protein